MRTIFLVLILSLICSIVSFAEEVTIKTGTADEGAFKAFLISAKSHEEITTIVQGGIFDSASNVKTIYPNKTISIAFGVNNLYIGADKSVNVVFDVKVLKPDQTILFDLPAYAKTRSAFNNNAFGDGTLNLTLEDSDPEGNYTVEAVAKDLVSGKEVKTQEIIIFRKEEQIQEIASMDDLGNFMTYYYQHKKDAVVIPALEYLLKQENLLADATHLKPVIHFFATIGNNNSGVVEQLKTLKSKYSGVQATVISEILQESVNFVSPEPQTAKDLDYLWSEFMATGDAMPVKKIISTLNRDAHGEMMLTAAAAEWSLSANGIQHVKVYDVIKSGSLSATGKAKEKLAQILQKIEAQRSR